MWPAAPRAQSPAPTRRRVHDRRHRAGGWTLYRKRRDVFGFVGNGHVKSEFAPLKPLISTLVGAKPEIVLAQSENGAIIHDLASIIAPNGISNAIDSDLANVSGHHAIKVSLGVWPSDFNWFLWHVKNKSFTTQQPILRQEVFTIVDCKKAIGVNTPNSFR